MVPILHGIVNPEGKVIFDPGEAGLRRSHLRQLAGQRIDVVIKVHRNTRSSRANRFYFGVVIALLAEHCGYERDEMHECLAMRFLRIEDDPITGAPRRKRTPKTDTKEFAEYVDSCMRFAAELGVYIPNPGEVAA